MILRIEDLRFAYGAKQVLAGLSIADVPAGSLTALVGPNAAGKTTLLKCIAGLLKPSGRVTLDGEEVRRMRRSEVTRYVSYLPQDVPVRAVLTVFEAVLLARQQSSVWRVSDSDLAAVEGALVDVDASHLASRYLNELSGGQRQLVSIAQALVRRPSVLLLDEPTSNLDLQRQLEVLALVRRFSEEHGMTTLVTLHDLNLASRFAAQVVVLNGGGVYSQGSPAEVITTAMVRDVYGVHAEVHCRADGVPQVHAIASLRGHESPHCISQPA